MIGTIENPKGGNCFVAGKVALDATVGQLTSPLAKSLGVPAIFKMYNAGTGQGWLKKLGRKFSVELTDREGSRMALLSVTEKRQ